MGKQKKNTKWRKRRKREMENEGEEVEETLVIEYKDRDNCIYVCFAGVSYATIHEMIYMISDAYRITSSQIDEANGLVGTDAIAGGVSRRFQFKQKKKTKQKCRRSREQKKKGKGSRRRKRRCRRRERNEEEEEE